MLSSGRYSELPSGQGLDGFCEMFYYNEERKQFQTAASKTWRRGGGMPNHAKYREAIIERLSGIGE